jgi:hypothetical protein
MASIFRSIRFGASSAHGKANMISFNYFLNEGAFSRSEDGIYSINFEEMQAAAKKLANEIITIQGDGNYDVAVEFVKKWGNINDNLQADLNSLTTKGIPVDIVFDQGIQNIKF